MFLAVLRIHDILVRIWIRASILLFSTLALKTPTKTNIKKVFVLITYEGTFTSFFIDIIFRRQKIKKKSQNNRNQGFSYYFQLMIEGSGSVPLTNRSGCVPLTNGSGSRRPKKQGSDGSRSAKLVFGQCCGSETKVSDPISDPDPT